MTDYLRNGMTDHLWNGIFTNLCCSTELVLFRSLRGRFQDARCSNLIVGYGATLHTKASHATHWLKKHNNMLWNNSTKTMQPELWALFLRFYFVEKLLVVTNHASCTPFYPFCLIGFTCVFLYFQNGEHVRAYVTLVHGFSGMNGQLLLLHVIDLHHAAYILVMFFVSNNNSECQ